MTKEKSGEFLKSDQKLGTAIRNACKLQFGVLDSGFMCQSIGSLELKKPICVEQTLMIEEVLKLLQANKIGSVLVVDNRGALTGIFTERDCVLKLMLKEIDLKTTPISAVMTKDPIAESPTTTIAYALNLMSNGGFRHIPIVGDDKMPIGVLSVKDIVDFIVAKLTDDLLNFELT